MTQKEFIEALDFNLSAERNNNDIIEIAEKLGLQIEYVHRHDFELIVNGDYRRIFLSDFLPLKKERFIIAHCIGHFILHTNHDELNNSFFRFGTSHQEAEASNFGMEILTPAGFITNVFKDLRSQGLKKKQTIDVLSDKFKLSTGVITSRLKNLRLLKETYDY